ncbi:hypothetical protein PV325_006566 [Microctonus aethiopoides]|nr:hypothetical protein PV325_006566 [Microctonus aethiopoides]
MSVSPDKCEVCRPERSERGNHNDNFFIFPCTDPPKILTRPRSQHVKAGGIASFYCSAHGAPPPQIHWRKNGKKVSSTATRYNTKTYANGALLRIDPVRPQRDDAMWECVAENGVGDAVTADAKLTVHEPSDIGYHFQLK